MDARWHENESSYHQTGSLGINKILETQGILNGGRLFGLQQHSNTDENYEIIFCTTIVSTKNTVVPASIAGNY